MFVVLYVVAAAMVVGGAFAVLTGWEILLLERGWSMVIAGATLATGGLVMAGVAAAARALATRLDSLADAVRASRNATPPAFPRRPGTPAGDASEGLGAAPEPAAPMPAREISPKLPPQDPAAPAGPAPAAALGIGGVAAEAAAPSLRTQQPEPQGGLPPLDLGPAPERASDEPESEAVRAEGLRLEKAPVEEWSVEEPPAHEPSSRQHPADERPEEPPSADAPPAGEAALVEDARTEPFAGLIAETETEIAPEPETEPETAPETAPEPEEREAPPQTVVAPGAGIEKPVLAPREPSRIAAEAEALTRRHEASVPAASPAGSETSEGEAPTAGETPPAPDFALEEAPEEDVKVAGEDAAPANAPRAEDAALGETPAEAEAEPPELPRVVGTHVSGANRYVMYSDGSIEAETPDGRLVFGSIEELKGYVASNGEDPSGANRAGPE